MKNKLHPVYQLDAQFWAGLEACPGGCSITKTNRHHPTIRKKSSFEGGKGAFRMGEPQLFKQVGRPQA